MSCGTSGVKWPLRVYAAIWREPRTVLELGKATGGSWRAISRVLIEFWHAGLVTRRPSPHRDNRGPYPIAWASAFDGGQDLPQPPSAERRPRVNTTIACILIRAMHTQALTQATIAELTGMRRNAVASTMREMCQLGIAHIAAWDVTNPRGDYAPMYRLALDQPNRRKPTAQSRTLAYMRERSKRSYARSRQLRALRALAGQQQESTCATV